MNPHDFVKTQVVNEALKAGAAKDIAERQGDLALAAYKEGRFKKASSMIVDHIKAAVKLTKDREKTGLKRV